MNLQQTGFQEVLNTDNYISMVFYLAVHQSDLLEFSVSSKTISSSKQGFKYSANTNKMNSIRIRLGYYVPSPGVQTVLLNIAIIKRVTNGTIKPIASSR